MKMGETKNVLFEVWNIKRTETKTEKYLVISFEKVNKTKEVKISEDEAEILNRGLTENPGNTEFLIYLKPGEEIPEVKKALNAEEVKSRKREAEEEKEWKNKKA